MICILRMDRFFGTLHPFFPEGEGRPPSALISVSVSAHRRSDLRFCFSSPSL